MLSVQSATQPKLDRPELPPLRQTSPSPRPTAVTPITSAVPPSPRPGPSGEGLDHWFEELQKYETTLGAMAAASEDPKFREELGTIEQWFKLLNESEQTASLYTLLQHANQAQVKFLAAVLTQMSTDNANPASAVDLKSKQAPRHLRPPSLNLPLPGSPATPHFNTPISAIPAQEKLGLTIPEQSQDVVVNGSNWANEVNTPLVRMFPNGSEGKQNAAAPAGVPGMVNAGMPAMPMMNPFNMAMLNQMGFSNEAQVLAVQMVMSGLMQPPATPGQKSGQRQPTSAKPSAGNNWRSPASAKYPASALRTGGLKSSGLKTSGLRSSGLRSATPLASAGATPKDSEDIDPELLKDVPAWLKSLRLHKYTSCFDGMTWEQMVELDEPALEAKGIVALGARRRLTKTFELVKKKMGMETSTPTADTIPSSAVLPTIVTNFPRANRADLTAPHSAAPTFSVNS